MKNKRKHPALYVIIFAILVIFVLLVLDIFNIPTKLGFNIRVINTNLWGIILSNIIVITLFMITFILFDRRNIEKDELGKYAGKVLLESTYESVKSFVPIICAIIKNKDCNEISKKIDFNYINNRPFDNEQKIFELLQNGFLEKKDYAKYIEIKQCYQKMVFIIKDKQLSTSLAKILLRQLSELLYPEMEKFKENKGRKNGTE